MLHEALDVAFGNSFLLRLLATGIGSTAAIAGAAFAIPTVADRMQPHPDQTSLADYLPFIRLMEDGKTVACINDQWIQVIAIHGAEITLAADTNSNGTGREDLWLARKQLLDDAFSQGIEELRFFSVKTRRVVEPAGQHPIAVLDAVQKKWGERFADIFTLRHYAVVSVRAKTFEEATKKLDKSAAFMSSKLHGYGLRVMQEPRGPGGNLADGPLAFLARICSPISRPTPRGLGYRDRVSYLLTADRISFRSGEKKGVLRFSNGREDRWGVVVGIRHCGDATKDSIMQAVLGLPIEIVVHQIVRPHDPARDLITLKIERANAPFMHLSRTAGHEIDNVITMVEGSDSQIRSNLHDYSLSVIITGRSLSECLEAEGRVHTAMTSSGATVVREHVSAQATWFAQFPADKQWPRMFRFMSQNIANMLHLQRPKEGLHRSNWSPRPICYFPTVDGEPYAFQWHAEESDIGDKETVAHCVAIGPTGAGKTLFISFCAAMSLAVPGLRTYMFDRLNGCEAMVRCSGGDYLEFDVGGRMNPLRQPDTPANRTFLKRWLGLLGDAQDASDDAEIARLIETIYSDELSDRQKSLKVLVNSSFEPGGRMRTNLQPWINDENYGMFFNAEHDSLDLKSKRIIGLDMTTVLGDKKLAPPVIDYLIHRITKVSMETGDPALVFIDETLPMLEGSPKFADSFVRIGLQEGRKIRQAYVLAFQSPNAINSTRLGATITQQCHTGFFFRNTNTKREDYTAWNLTDAELDFVTGKSYSDVRYAVLIKKFTSGESAILNIDLAIIERYLKVFNSGRTAIIEMQEAMREHGPHHFIEPYLNGNYRRKTA